MKETIKQQRAYFETGATWPLQARKDALKRLRDCIKAHEADISKALHEDLGKSETEVYMTEIGMLYDDINYTLKKLHSWMRPHRRTTPLAISPAKSRLLYCPYGVALIIAPWNYPLLLSLSPLVGAIAAGNCCVVKPSELAPASAKVITTILNEAFSRQLVAVFNGGIETSQALLEERFDYIFYTGNTQVGRIIMEKASRHLTPVTLELGGKSPVVVTRSAHLRLTARRIAFGKLLNLGQTCVAPDYILVEQPVHDELITLLKEEIVKMYGDTPLQNEAYGKMINRRHFERVCRLINPGKVVFGGETEGNTLRIAPTIMDGVDTDDAVMKEEIFGPILPIITVENTEQAFRFIQERPHPLALYLFSEDKREEKRFMEQLQFGGGCVNDVIVHLSNHNIPFGGIGESGMGQYHGKPSFETFSHAKAIVKSSTWIDIPVRYQPYTSWKNKLLHKFM